MYYLKSFLAGAVLLLIAEVYFARVQGDSQPGMSSLKVGVVALFFVVILLSQLLIVGRAEGNFWNYFRSGMWILLFFLSFISVDAFTFHRGLAKDADVTVINLAKFLLLNLGVFGLPVLLLTSSLAALARRTVIRT